MVGYKGIRRVCYVTGTRADFGLMVRTLRLAQQSGRLDVSLCVTGAHLCQQFGHTIEEVEASGLRICGQVPVIVDGTTGAMMAKALGQELLGITDVLERENPNLVVVLGDRGEMLAAAVAAIHLNLAIVHVHGGERSGTVDEPIRHAISKLAHYHFVSTDRARERLIRMGEQKEHVFVTGAPGLDNLTELVRHSRADLCAEHGFDAQRPIAVVLFHAVLQEASQAGEQMEQIMKAVLDCGIQILALSPNSDAGGLAIDQVLHRHTHHSDLRIVTHLRREDFVSWMAAADVMVGNSSSGVIESASLGLRTVNIGSRQRFRERNPNVVDVPPNATMIAGAIRNALSAGRGKWKNVYGDGNAAQHIVDRLATLPITPQLLNKANAY
jgi:GDP/UDP-N,N'-diacetylbacillosamine 2-epimerase (hydrolysing)